MISIILNSYAPTKSIRHSEMAAVAAIRKFTDPPYEIIIIDNCQVHRFRDDYGVLAPYTLIENKRNRTCYASYNQGAKLAKGEYLVFTQSDVFVNEGTINKLVKYLGKYDVAYPQQVELSREQVQAIYDTPDGEQTVTGYRDAGMLAITRKAFDRTGGWDGRFRNLLGDAAFYERIDKVGLTWTAQTNAIITHIMAGNNLSKSGDIYNEEMEHDAELLKEYSYGQK